MILLKKPYIPSVGIGQVKTFNVYGKSFFNIKNVYLRGRPYVFDQTFFNPFSGIPALSGLYPPFNAIKIDPSQFTTNNDNVLTFVMPSAERGGFVDIILENQAGYGALTQYVIRDTYNPYVSGTSDYEAFKPYVRPWSQGIQVVGTDIITYIITINNILIKKLDGTGYMKTIDGTDADPFAIMGAEDDTIITAIDGSDIVQIT